MVLEGPLLAGGSRQFESLLNHGSHSLKCCSFPFSPFPSLPFPLTPAGQLFSCCPVLMLSFPGSCPARWGVAGFRGKWVGQSLPPCSPTPSGAAGQRRAKGHLLQVEVSQLQEHHVVGTLVVLGNRYIRCMEHARREKEWPKVGKCM